MSYTKFGEFMRIQRVKNHEVMGDTAKLLDVKLPFVSTVESGKRNVPEEWIPILIAHYNLNAEEQAELFEAVEQSKTQLKSIWYLPPTPSADWRFSFSVLLKNSMRIPLQPSLNFLIRRIIDGLRNQSHKQK